MPQSAKGTSVVEDADCVELASVLVAVDVGTTLMPVVCSWALPNDEPPTSSIKQAAKWCPTRPFAIANLVKSLVRRSQRVAVRYDVVWCYCLIRGWSRRFEL